MYKEFAKKKVFGQLTLESNNGPPKKKLLKNLSFFVNCLYKNNVLVFMLRDPGDTTSKVSHCVEP